MAEIEIDIDPFIGNHNRPHQPTRISLKRQDSVMFTCRRDFEIVGFELEANADQRAPRHPFHRPLSFDAFSDGANPNPRFRANSGPSIPKARGAHYKTWILVKAGGGDQEELIDPDIIIEN